MRKLQVYFMLILSLCSITARGQKGISLPFSSFYDENAWLSLGLQYNYVNSTYRLGLKENWGNMGIRNVPVNNDLRIEEFSAIQAKPSQGMSVSIPVELRLSDNLSTTFQPTFNFLNTGGVNYSGTQINSGGEEMNVTITRNMLHRVATNIKGENFNAFEFPLNLKFRSDEKVLPNKFNRYRGYLTGGVRYTRWVDIQKSYSKMLLIEDIRDRPQNMIFKPGYYSWEVGFGAEIFFTYFRMSPEIKFIQSFGDILDHGHELTRGNAFMAPLDKTLIRNIQFSLIFQ